MSQSEPPCSNAHSFLWLLNFKFLQPSTCSAPALTWQLKLSLQLTWAVILSSFWGPNPSTQLSQPFWGPNPSTQPTQPKTTSGKDMFVPLLILSVFSQSLSKFVIVTPESVHYESCVNTENLFLALGRLDEAKTTISQFSHSLKRHDLPTDRRTYWKTLEKSLAWKLYILIENSNLTMTSVWFKVGMVM